MSLRHIALLSVLLTGCASFQPQPVDLPLNPPAHWHIGAGAGEAVGSSWWYAFGDEERKRLGGRAISKDAGRGGTGAGGGARSYAA